MNTRLENEEVMAINCQSFANIVETYLGHNIPWYYRSSERLFDPDNVYLNILYPEERPQTGDVFGFSPYENTDPREIHLGIARVDRLKGIEIIHATKSKSMRLDGVVITPLSEMISIPKYHSVRFVKRAKDIQVTAYNPERLFDLEFLSESFINDLQANFPTGDPFLDSLHSLL